MARRAGGWLPTYHGAWAMIIAPPITGILLTTFTWWHILFLITWWAGYFAYFASMKWIRAHRKERFQPAVLTYTGLTLATLIPLLIAFPALVKWGAIFGPLIALTAFLTYRGQERSLLNDIVTVAAASLSLPVVAHLADLATDVVINWHYIWLVTMSVTAYFVGTAFYVKTNIRERGNEIFFLMAVAYHIIAATAVTSFVIGDDLRLGHAIVWWLLVVRTFVIASYSAKIGRRISAKAIGLGEVAATIAVVGTLL